MVLKIQPTHHALNRFEQRIKPMLSAAQREHLRDLSNVQRVLFSICSKLKLNHGDSTKQRFEALFYRDGKPPLRLALVIDVN